MNKSIFFIYLAIMAGSTYLIRTVPFVAITKKIENPYIRSFLSYIPYAVLTAMTLPACLFATDYILSASVGILVAIIFAMKNKSLTVVAIAACFSVWICEFVLRFLGF